MLTHPLFLRRLLVNEIAIQQMSVIELVESRRI